MKKLVEKLKTVKPIYYVIVLVAVLTVVGVAIFRPSYSVESSLLDDKVLDGLTITNISLVEDQGVATYQATVTATRNINVNTIEIVLTTDKGAITLYGYVGKSMLDGEATVITASTDADILQASAINYIVK